MRAGLGLLFLLIGSFSGCCYPVQPSMCVTSPPVRHRVDVLQNGGREYYNGFKGDIWVEQAPPSK